MILANSVLRDKIIPQKENMSLKSSMELKIQMRSMDSSTVSIIMTVLYCLKSEQKKKNKLLDQYECMNVCCFDAKYPNKP